LNRIAAPGAVDQLAEFLRMARRRERVHARLGEALDQGPAEARPRTDDNCRFPCHASASVIADRLPAPGVRPAVDTARRGPSRRGAPRRRRYGFTRPSARSASWTFGRCPTRAWYAARCGYG